MKRTIAILLAVIVVASTLGAQAHVNDGLWETEAIHEQPHASVPSATSPSSDHVSQASERAESLVDQMPAQASERQAQQAADRSDFQTRFATKTNELQQAATRAETGWDRTVVHRSIALNARVAVAHQEAKQGDLTENDVRQQTEELRSQIDSFEKRTSYRADSPTEAVVLVGEIETSLTSAEGWLEQIPEILERDDLSEEERIAYAAGSLEAARGNLEDARLLHTQYRTELQSGTDQEAALEDRYDAIRSSVQERIDATSYSEDAYGQKMAEKAEHYLDRAETRYEAGYKAAALRDVLRAELFLNGAEATANVEKPNSDVEPAEIEAVSAEKDEAVQSLNTTLENTDNGVVLMLLQHSERQLVGGNEDAEWVLEHPDAEAQQQAYARYVVAGALADSAEDTADLLEE